MLTYIEIKNDNDEYFIEFSRVLGVAHKLQLALKYAINTKSTIVQVILLTHYSRVSSRQGPKKSNATE